MSSFADRPRTETPLMWLTSWLHKRASARNPKPRTERPTAFRPQLEALEDRTLPSFLAPSGSSAGSPSYALVAADLNADGRSDLVSVGTNTNSVTVLLASGGGFSKAKSYGVGASPTAVAAGDV